MSIIHFKQLLFLCECGRVIKGMNECFIVLCYSAVSGAGPPKVKLGAGMKAISSLALTKCELDKSLESLLLLHSGPSAPFISKLSDLIILRQ